MAAAGVPSGATTSCHPPAAKPGKVSATVGRSGKSNVRRSISATTHFPLRCANPQHDFIRSAISRLRGNALRGENVEDLVGIGKQWSVIEGQHHFLVIERHGIRILHVADPWILSGIDCEDTARAKRVRTSRTVGGGMAGSFLSGLRCGGFWSYPELPHPPGAKANGSAERRTVGHNPQSPEDHVIPPGF